jgi:hypothetical protein
MPVKYAFGKNVKISSVPGKSGIVNVVDVTTVAFEVAAAAVVPNPRNTMLLPAGITTRYWLEPSPLDTACTGVGAEVAAVKTTVFPKGVKA